MRDACRRAVVPGLSLVAVLLLPILAQAASLEAAASAPFALSPAFRSLPVPPLGPSGPVLPKARPVPPGTPASGETFDAQVTAVSDGDTLRLVRGDKEFKCRLAEVDAPEKAMPYGPEAGARLSQLVMGRTVTVKVREVDQYGRLVVWVTLGGELLHRRLLAEGQVWWYRYYSKDPSLGELEAQAKAARRGLWADPNPEAPWEWRRRNRGMFPADDEPPFDPMEGPDSDALTAPAAR